VWYQYLEWSSCKLAEYKSWILIMWESANIKMWHSFSSPELESLHYKIYSQCFLGTSQYFTYMFIEFWGNI
jgi:hypothetical protein